MVSSRVFINIDGSWEELATCTDIEFDLESKGEFNGFGKSVNEFGTVCIEFKNHLIAINTKKLNKPFREIQKTEQWKGEGKRKMKVIK